MADHTKVKKLFREYEKAGAKKKATLAGEILNELNAHSTIRGGDLLSRCTVLRQLPPPETAAAAKRAIVEAIEQTSACLGNTPAVCRTSYVHPAILDACAEGWMQGGSPDGGMGRGAPGGLAPEEEAVLRLLRRAKRRRRRRAASAGTAAPRSAP